MTGQRIRVSHNDHTAPANVESPRLQLIVKFTSFLCSEFVKQVCVFLFFPSVTVSFIVFFAIPSCFDSYTNPEFVKTDLPPLRTSGKNRSSDLQILFWI